MNDKTVEIEITVSMFSLSPTHGAYINIDSVIDTTALGKLVMYTTLLHYNNMKLKNIECDRGYLGKYFDDLII